jgi:glycosyltransferase involved in cell wall biosynthesis
MNKKISVVIPTYNEERYIERCLNSLVNQSLHRDEFELIVVDGGSTDRTVALAQDYADIVMQQKSKGVGGARNDGVDAASAELIATTDADIILPGDWLARICANLARDGVFLTYGPINPIEDEFKYRFSIGLFNKIMHVSAILRVFYFTIGSNTAFRKRAFLQVGGYSDMPAGDDYGIALKLKRTGRIVYDPYLHVWFSMRRMEKFGILRALYVWALNVVAAKRGKRPKLNYMQQTYK